MFISASYPFLFYLSFILIDCRIIAVCAWYYPANGDEAGKCNQVW